MFHYVVPSHVALMSWGKVIECDCLTPWCDGMWRNDVTEWCDGIWQKMMAWRNITLCKWRHGVTEWCDSVTWRNVIENYGMMLYDIMKVTAWSDEMWQNDEMELWNGITYGNYIMEQNDRMTWFSFAIPSHYSITFRWVLFRHAITFCWAPSHHSTLI